MSCQLIPFSWFDINVVKRRLFPEKLTDTPDTHLEWPEDFDEDCSLSNSESNITWLQECHVYLSPSREILVFANKSIVVILTSKWESQTKNNVSCKYVLLWSGSLQQEKIEEITSVICLPLASVGRSSHHGADWTCIVVGYTTGYVRFFTENGSLMVSEFFHEEPVLHIKCQSYQASTYPGELEHHEELLITYRSAVVSLNGFALFQTLRGCRSHLARVKANCGEVMKPPPLAYKKWGFMEQRIGLDEVGVSDCEVVGPSTPHTFDHLHQHHIISSQLSYVGSIKPRAPATSLVIATGSHPFVGFHYSIEGATRQVIYHDVARAVTDRLKETLSHTVSTWIFGAQNTQDKAAEERTTTEPADPMDCRFGLCDPLRKGDNIVMTQNRRLSAVTDNLGRIILIDNFKGIAVRIWKGYRDAHCGWMEVFEESLDQLPSSGGTGDKREHSFSKPHVDSVCLRMAHFLIVHCPRSSLLQVLSVQKGSKIATIPMTKGSRLLYINHGIVGTNNVLHKKKRGYVESSCVIIEPNGLLKEVVVPFHFALSEESSEKVRDIHLIRRLKKVLRNAGGNRAFVKGSGNDPNASEEICSLIRELKCDESLTLVLLTMSNHRHTTAPLFLSSINTILQRLETRVNKSHVPVLWSMCCQLRQLINLYAEAVVSFEGTIGSKIKKKSDAQIALKLKNNESMKILTNNLKLSEFEAKDLLNLVQIFWTSQGARHRAPAVTFEENIYLPLVDFLSCFDLITSEKNLGDIYRLEETGIRKTSFPLPISLKSGLQEQDMGNLCRLLFYCCLSFKDIPNNWKSAIVFSGIEKKDLLSMAIHTWLQFGWEFLGDSIVEVLQRLMSNIKAVCYMSGSKELAEEEFCIHCLPWWEDVRNLLASWHSPFLALIGALMTRAVALNDMSCATKCPLPLQDEELLVSPSPEEGKEGPKVIREDGWERVSVEGMAWDKLVRNLEDLAYLEAAVSWPLVRSPVTISLEMVTAKGRGCVSEMVAQWVLSCSTLFGSDHWGPTALVSFLQKSIEDGCPEEKKESTVFEALGLLGLLKLRFPFSLSASTLLANVCWECARCFASQGDCSIPVLSGALCWLQSIPSSRIRRGLCGLLWTVHLEHRIKAGAQLLECYPFMDAIPERVMLNEVGLPSLVMLHDLFENAYKFLDIMTELAASVLDEEEEEEALRWEEEMWGPPEKQVLQQGEGGGSGPTPPPLVELALLQPPLPPSLNLQRLTLYHQLCLILCLISRIHPKGPTGLCQPISQLFAVEERALLLSSEDSDIHVKREKNPVGPALITLRMSFVKKSISAVCRSVDYYENLSKELIGLIFKASEMFGLPMDNIRRHYVCELYSCGHDREAEELMATVVDKENLASQLLVIVFHRLKYYLDHSGDGDHRSEVVATFSPASLARLNNQQSSYLVCKDIPMQSTEQLLSILIAYLHEESKLYSEALGILDAVRVLASQEY